MILVALCFTPGLCSFCLAQATDPRASELQDPEPVGTQTGNIPVKTLRRLLSQGQWAQTEAVLNSVKRTKGSEYTRQLWLGLCRARAGDHETACAIFEKCQPLHDLSSYTRYLIGDSYECCGNAARAAEVLKVIPDQAGNSRAFEVRVDAEIVLGKYDQAVADLRTITRLNPRVKRRYLNQIAELYVRQGRLQEALDQYNQMFDGPDKMPKDTDVIGRAMCLKKWDGSQMPSKILPM